MKKIQQEVMCVLLQTLLDKERISKDLYDKTREKILGTTDWPAFFYTSDAGIKGESDGGA